MTGVPRFRPSFLTTSRSGHVACYQNRTTAKATDSSAAQDRYHILRPRPEPVEGRPTAPAWFDKLTTGLRRAAWCLLLRMACSSCHLFPQPRDDLLGHRLDLLVFIAVGDKCYAI